MVFIPPTSEGDDDDFPSISGMIARYSASGLTNEQMATNPVWVDKTGNGHDIQLKTSLGRVCLELVGMAMKIIKHSINSH